jgi:hypothetical protein
MNPEEIRLHASHRQFYIQDSEPPGSTDDPAFWTERTSQDRLAIAEGILGIGTGSYDFVTVRVEGFGSQPPLDLSQWDHVTEAGLQVRTGLLLVMGCLSDSGLFFRVRPGHYRVRCCHANLAASVDSTGDAGDWYSAAFWPSAPAPPTVPKRWTGSASQGT